MFKIREIEEAVSSMPDRDYAQFRMWFQKFEAQKWDKQYESDVKAGKLDRLAEKAVDDYKKGKCKEL